MKAYQRSLLVFAVSLQVLSADAAANDSRKHLLESNCPTALSGLKVQIYVWSDDPKFLKGKEVLLVSRSGESIQGVATEVPGYGDWGFVGNFTLTVEGKDRAFPSDSYQSIFYLPEKPLSELQISFDVFKHRPPVLMGKNVVVERIGESPVSGKVIQPIYVFGGPDYPTLQGELVIDTSSGILRVNAKKIADIKFTPATWSEVTSL